MPVLPPGLVRGATGQQGIFKPVDLAAGVPVGSDNLAATELLGFHILRLHLGPVLLLSALFEAS
jgi:hypothetical protein